MDTPTTPNRGAFDPLYGNGEQSINRRAVIGAAGIAVIAPMLTRAAPQSRSTLADLARMKALRWDGHAQIAAKDNLIDLSVQTRVEPFIRATSRSWVTRQGSWTARTMTIDPDSGYVERDGKRSAMPVGQAIHERQQFAIYGFMLEALAKTPLAPPGMPRPTFTFAGDDLLRDAVYRVRAPDGKSDFDEQLTFEGLAANSTFWPAKMTLRNPDFTLILWFDVFAVELN